jgi:HAMP domain-containing protein
MYLILGALGLLGTILLSSALISSIVKLLGQAIHFAGQIAKGNLNNTIPHNGGHDEISQLLDAFAAMQTQLREIIGLIQQNSDELVRSAKEFYEAANDVTKRSQTQSEATADIAASVEEMTQSIHSYPSTPGRRAASSIRRPGSQSRTAWRSARRWRKCARSRRRSTSSPPSSTCWTSNRNRSRRSSASSRRWPNRPTCSRSTPPSKRRAPANRAGVSP